VYDSYIPFAFNSLKKVHTQVHFLEAIPYEVYEGMKTVQIRDMVVQRIEERICRLEQSSHPITEGVSGLWNEIITDASEAAITEQLS
jgi:hypothetical protein